MTTGSADASISQSLGNIDKAMSLLEGRIGDARARLAALEPKQSFVKSQVSWFANLAVNVPILILAFILAFFTAGVSLLVYFVGVIIYYPVRKKILIPMRRKKIEAELADYQSRYAKEVDRFNAEVASSLLPRIHMLGLATAKDVLKKTPAGKLRESTVLRILEAEARAGNMSRISLDKSGDTLFKSSRGFPGGSEVERIEINMDDDDEPVIVSQTSSNTDKPMAVENSGFGGSPVVPPVPVAMEMPGESGRTKVQPGGRSDYVDQSDISVPVEPDAQAGGKSSGAMKVLLGILISLLVLIFWASSQIEDQSGATDYSVENSYDTPVVVEPVVTEPPPTVEVAEMVDGDSNDGLVESSTAPENSPEISADVAMVSPGITSQTRQGPSFDCRKATTLIEGSICSNDELASLDLELSGLYRAAMDAYQQNPEITQNQRAWLRDIRDACTNIDCIKVAYQGRIAEFRDFLGRQ